VVSPVPGEQLPAIDTLEGVVVSPIDGEQAPEADADSSAEDSDSEKEDSDPESGDDELDEEKQSIWNKVLDKTKNLGLKAASTFGTTLFVAGNYLPKPKQRFEKNETEEQFKARVERYGAAKIVGVVALILAAKYGLPLLSGGEAHASGSGSGLDKHIADIAPPSGLDGGSGVELFSADAHTVTRGEGWYQTFKELNITNATEQASLLQKVGPELQARGWAYPMENGSWGISHTGQLPDDVLKLIKNSR
ncbi:hypothetical protein H7X68_00515, partial [Candidatus Saccharibacteria bacterium]|nr:hypothetical protein [Candidatus Saccharibacteria bacterium]